MTNTELQVKHTCCARISLGAFYGTKACGKTAKFDRDGRHYCGTHDPVTIAEKYAAKTAKWRKEWADKDAARDAEKAKQAEIERRADCYTELLEALKMALSIIRVQNGNRHNDTNKAQEIISAAIAKAEGKA